MKTKDFIIKAQKIHGDKYDYSKVDYIHSTKKVIIICPEHGEFEQKASSHLIGKGCFKCAVKLRSQNKKSNTKDFIIKAQKIHGDKYDYSKVDYIHSTKKVIIICPEHGEFEQIPKSHLQGFNCLKCSQKTTFNKLLKPVDIFIEQSKKIHIHRRKSLGLSEYEFDVDYNTQYNGSHQKINIWCNEVDENGIAHGWFQQTPMNHLQGSEGCLKCSNHGFSKLEKEVLEFIKSLFL